MLKLETLLPLNLQKYAWRWRRLRAMSAAEIVHRTRRAVGVRLESLGIGRVGRVPAPQLRSAPARLVGSVPELDPKPYLRAADAIVDGHLPLFALQPAKVGNPPRWNRDPLTGTVAPLKFGKLIDYRDPKVVGDIKYVWELNRHLHLVTLAQAYRLSMGEQYLDTLVAHVDSWLKECPYPSGPNWTSSLELAIRLINWAIVWNLLAQDDYRLVGHSDGLHCRWLEAIYRHCHFIQGHLSHFSSANNHLIGEAAGLLVASVTWPYWREAEDWFEVGYRELYHEALLQNAPDGVNLEQSTWYQQFVFDLMLIGGLAARERGRDFPSEYWLRLEAMVEYVTSVMDVQGNVPMTGDADDGLVVRLDPSPGFDPFKSILFTAAAHFSRSDFKSKVGALKDHKTLWLLGEPSGRAFETLLAPNRASFRTSFPDGGYYVLGRGLETNREVRIVVDAGPLGYTSIAAHGHADALAFVLSAAGSELLIDPGTYAYHTNDQWRDYFRGTSAHNTARVDGEDQSVIGGNFLWTSRAKAWCETWESSESQDLFVGVHDGYLRFPDPVLHRRELRLRKDGASESPLIVVDTFRCEGSHRIELFTHFSENCRVEPISTKSIVGICDDIRLEITMDHPADMEIHRGDASIPAGWISRRFDVKTPTTTVVWGISIDGTTSITTEIRCEFGRHGSG